MLKNFSYSQTLKKLDKSTNRPLYRGTQHEMVRNLKLQVTDILSTEYPHTLIHLPTITGVDDFEIKIHSNL